MHVRTQMEEHVQYAYCAHDLNEQYATHKQLVRTLVRTYAFAPGIFLSLKKYNCRQTWVAASKNLIIFGVGTAPQNGKVHLSFSIEPFFT